MFTVISAGCTQQAGKGQETTSATITFTDSNGNTITLPKTAERIIATNKDCAEMLIAIGMADKIVGISDTVAKDPILTAQLPKNVSNIGNWQTPNIEMMTTLKPDVVICYGGASKPKNMDQILAANLTLVYLDCYKMNTLSHDARALGNITGNTKKAEEYASFIEKYQNMVKSKTSKLSADQKPTVYWESYSDYSAAGNTSGGDTMINMCGGVNIVARNASLYASAFPKVSSEWIIANNPSYVFKMVSAEKITSLDDLKKVQSAIKSRTGMDKTNAVKNDSVYVMSSGVAYGPRAVVGMLYVAKILHPDLYKDVDPQAVLSEYAQKYLPGSDKGYFIYPTPA